MFLVAVLMGLGSNTNFSGRERADSFQHEELIVWV